MLLIKNGRVIDPAGKKERNADIVVKDGKIDLSEVGLDEDTIRNVSQIYIVACGSAYHVGMAAQYVL